MTPQERRLRAQIAANIRWSKPGARVAQSRTMRESRLAYFERQVDPDGVLSGHERSRLADSALKADMQRLALKSSKARRQQQEIAP